MNEIAHKADSLLGVIEGGGTKFLCGFGSAHDQLQKIERISTTSPEETLAKVCEFFKSAPPLDAIGLGMFGPIELKGNSKHAIGTTLRTPKKGWDYIPVKSILEKVLDIPVVVDTDVNGAALAEYLWGASQQCDPTVYVTIGTGIGAGVIVGGKPLHGLMHPEFGHMPVPVLEMANGEKDDFHCRCPFHTWCLEGVASGSAFSARTKGGVDALAKDDPLWELEANYLAHGLAACTYMLSPERIVLGGGMLKNPGVLERVRSSLKKLVAGYIPHKKLNDDIDNYLVYPHFEQQAGLIGAFALAKSHRLPSTI
ncbi:MAG: ROK family protein [Myxococcales bacterium]|nr:MAG: ROK family protein [Myxococcales bacterium]